MADEARDPAALERDTASADARQSGALSRQMERALHGAGSAGPAQQWLDEFRWEHNQVRPHEALGCGRRPACGGRARATTIRSRRAGSIRRERRCGGWMAWQAERVWTQLEDRPGAAGRMGATDADGRTGAGVLLPHRGARTRPRDPAFDRGRTLDRRLRT